MKEKEFVIRTYLKSELASLYHPYMSAESAMRKMRRWINYNPELKAQMEALSTSRTDHQYTPRQVGLLVKYLGEPYGQV